MFRWAKVADLQAPLTAACLSAFASRAQRPRAPHPIAKQAAFLAPARPLAAESLAQRSGDAKLFSRKQKACKSPSSTCQARRKVVVALAERLVARVDFSQKSTGPERGPSKYESQGGGAPASLSAGGASGSELIAKAACSSGFAREHGHDAEAGKVRGCRRGNVVPHNAPAFPCPEGASLSRRKPLSRSRTRVPRHDKSGSGNPPF